jgi:hypothetical protein
MPLRVPHAGPPGAGCLPPGRFGAVEAWQYDADALPDGASIDADKAAKDYAIADLRQDIDHMHLLPIRQKNAKRALSPSSAFVHSEHRNRVATAGSLIAPL